MFEISKSSSWVKLSLLRKGWGIVWDSWEAMKRSEENRFGEDNPDSGVVVHRRKIYQL